MGLPVPKNMPEHLRKKLGIEDEVVTHNPVLDALKTYGKKAFAFAVDNAITLLAVPAVASLALKVNSMHEEGEIVKLWETYASQDISFNLVAFVAVCAFFAFMYVRSVLFPQKPVYLVDFEVNRPPAEWNYSRDSIMQKARNTSIFSADQIEFQMKVLLHSGLGNMTCVPTWLTEDPPTTTMEAARSEFDTVCFSTVASLLKKCNVRPKDVGIVIVNCSLFSPTPSLTATIMNHFKMPSTTIGYNLSGMGCSAGVIAIDLARELLQNHSNKLALVISTENITQNIYRGRQKSMLIPNVIFRCGAAAMLVSNRPLDSWRAKYKLQHLVRTMNSTDRGYGCVMELEDEEGIRGVKLSRELMKVAGDTLKMNITRLGPLVLPPSELILAGLNMAAMKIWGPKKVKPYVPDFTKVFQHLCIHTGGRGVIDAIEDQMGFSKEMVEPSRASLFRFGNVSSASIWYVLAFTESFRGVKRGQKVWQMGFGSGFKCNSAVWVANKHIKHMHSAWEDFIGTKAMYEDLAGMDSELWRIVEMAMEKREEQLAEARARGEDISQLSSQQSLTNTVEHKMK